jgi:exosortase
LFYLPARLVEEANPEWRLVSWTLSLIVVGLTLLLLHRSGPSVLVRRMAFPVMFFLVAVPWPTVVEAPLIQNLTKFNAAASVELLNLIGTPAMRRGNVIEISAGLVGIEEACSGIRSFQACLMIALFLGAYYQLRHSRRVQLVVAGFALALLFNLGRTVLLVSVASRKGMAAIAEWHDPAGVTILVGCFTGVWLVAARLRRLEWGRGSKVITSPSEVVNHPTSVFVQRGILQVSAATAIGLAAWLLFTETGVEWWYRRHEQQPAKRALWTVQWPREEDAFRELPFNERTVQLLRFDEGMNASWRLPDGSPCQAIFLRWKPGRIAVHLARSHTPEVCLTAGGRQLAGAPESRFVRVNGLDLPFDVYHVRAENLWVYYCLWEDRIWGETSATEQLSYENRLKPVLAGRRNLGQRSLEFAVWSAASEAEVEALVAQCLNSIIRPQKLTATSENHLPASPR